MDRTAKPTVKPRHLSAGYSDLPKEEKVRILMEETGVDARTARRFVLIGTGEHPGDIRDSSRREGSPRPPRS